MVSKSKVRRGAAHTVHNRYHGFSFLPSLRASIIHERHDRGQFNRRCDVKNDWGSGKAEIAALTCRATASKGCLLFDT